MKCALQSLVGIKLFQTTYHGSPADRSLCLLLLLFTFLPEVNAQSPAYFRYNASAGLACKEVYDVLQDKAGFIWTATDRGVFRYDGYHFQPFTTAQGLTDNTVFLLEEDFRGRIWTMPFNGKLCYIEQNKVVPYAFNDTLEKYLPGTRIARSLHVLPSGAIQIGFLMHGIVEISERGVLKWISGKGPNAQMINTALEEKDGQILVGTLQGTLSPTISFVFHSGILSATAEISNQALRQHITGIRRLSGSWCFGVQKDLIEIDVTGKIVVTPLPFQALDIFEDSAHCLWLGFDGGGARRYAPNSSAANGTYEDFYPGETITCIAQDFEGGFWLGSHRNGLLYVQAIDVRSWKLPSAPDDEVIALMPGPAGSMYTLWSKHGLARIQNNAITELPVSQPATALFRTMTLWRQQHEIIIGTTHSTLAFDLESETYSVRSIYSSHCAVNTHRGVFLGSSWVLRLMEAAGSERVVCDASVRRRPDVLYADKKGEVWMGGIDGLHLVTDSSLISYGGVHPIFQRRVASMCELTDSSLVVATQSNGIALLHNGKVRTLTQSDSFPCDMIVSVAAGINNSFWASTKNGLYKVVVTPGEFTVEHYRGLEGILGNGGVCYFDTSQQKMWLTSENSIVSFDPGKQAVNKKGPPVYVTAVMVGDSSLSLAGNAELGPDKNFLRISFSGLAYRLHGNIAYRYRLSGQENWKYTTQNTVEFATLEPDQYRFEVQAQNENGVWSETSAAFPFVILPSFTQTWWFKTGLWVIVALLIYAGIRTRFRIMRKQDLLREQALIFRQQALASQMNPHFVFNALNVIQSFVLNDKKTKALDMFSSFATLLRKSLEHAGERHIILSEEISALQLYFELETMRFEERLSYSISVDQGIDPKYIAVPAMLVQPIAENAIKHGINHRPAGGSVAVRFRMLNNQMVCEVEDDGVGRVASARLSSRTHKHAGVRITEDRLRVLSQMNKSVFSFETIDKYVPGTEVASGTLVRFVIPSIILKKFFHEEVTSTDR